MRVAVIGGTGFVGAYIVDALLAAGHQPVVLVRPGSEHKLRQAERCRVHSGTVDDRDAIAAAMTGADAALFLIGILREEPSRGITFEALQYEAARRSIDVAAEQGVQRFLLMSANGVEARRTPYQRSKYRAEQYLENSGLDWTVFRPSVIFGDPRGTMEFCTQLRDQVVKPPLPAASFFHGLSASRGEAVMSPVHVEDVAECFVRSLGKPATVQRVFPLGGPETLSWSTILFRIAAACGRHKWIVPVPAPAVYMLAWLFDRFSWFPLTRDQLTMLMQGNTVRDYEAFELLGMKPRGMTVEALAYLEE